MRIDWASVVDYALKQGWAKRAEKQMTEHEADRYTRNLARRQYDARQKEKRKRREARTQNQTCAMA